MMARFNVDVKLLQSNPSHLNYLVLQHVGSARCYFLSGFFLAKTGFLGLIFCTFKEAMENQMFLRSTDNSCSTKRAGILFRNIST
jgi:hypothetical protein